MYWSAASTACGSQTTHSAVDSCMGFHVRAPTLHLSHTQPLDNLRVKDAGLQTKNFSALQCIETMASSSYVPPHVCRMPLVQFLSTTALPRITDHLCTAIVWMYDARDISFKLVISLASSDRVSDSSFALSNIYSFVAVLLYRQ